VVAALAGCAPISSIATSRAAALIWSAEILQGNLLDTPRRELDFE